MSKRSFKTKRYIFGAIYLALALFAIIQAMLSAKYSSAVSSAFTSLASFTIFGKEVTDITLLGKALSFDDFAAFMRKLVGHFGLFAAMGLFGFLALYKVHRTKKVLIIDLLTTFLIAILTETIQSLVPSRAGLFSDIVLDTQGAIAAVATLVAFISLRSRIKRKKHKRLTLYIFVPSVVFATLFLAFNPNSFYNNFCFALYIFVCSICVAATAAADLF